MVVWLLALIGLVTAQRLRKWRKFAVLGSLIIGAAVVERRRNQNLSA